MSPTFQESSFYRGNCSYRLYYRELSNFPLEAPRSPVKRYKAQKVAKNSAVAGPEFTRYP
jgi:hypothetical protein